MTKISFDKLEKIIKENSDYLNKTIYTHNYEQIYNFIKNFIINL